MDRQADAQLFFSEGDCVAPLGLIPLDGAGNWATRSTNIWCAGPRKQAATRTTLLWRANAPAFPPVMERA